MGQVLVGSVLVWERKRGKGEITCTGMRGWEGGCGGPKSCGTAESAPPASGCLQPQRIPSSPPSTSSKTLFSSAKTSTTTPERRARPASLSSTHSLQRPAKNMAYAQPFPLAQQQQKVQQPQFGPDLAIRLICPDCRDPNPKLSEEFSSGDLVCQSCGLVLGDRIVDTRSEWRVSTLHLHSTRWSFNSA